MYSSERSTRKIEYMYMAMYKYIRYIYTIHHADTFFVFFQYVRSPHYEAISTQYPQGEHIHTGTQLLEDERMRDAAAPGRDYVYSRKCTQTWRTHLHSGRKTEMQ